MSPRPGRAKCAPTGTRRPSTAASSAFSRSKCRPSNSPPASSPSRPEFRRTRSGAAASTKPISKRSRTFRSSCKIYRSTSTKPAVFRSGNWRRAHAGSSGRRGLDLLVIDYIQLLQGTSRRASENRVQEITEITTRLKALAKELNIPILALSQLSRQVEGREDKRPQLSDLRESGSIEQDADVVMFVFREEYYHQMRKAPRKQTVKNSRSGWPRANGSLAKPKSSSASSVTGQPGRSSCNSTPRSHASPVWIRRTARNF